MTTDKFQRIIHDYYAVHGRRFPWRKTKNPYHVFVSEIMLQQTQAPRVVDKYKLFVRTFSGFSSLAQASLRRIYRVWQGLGYNRRALYLKRAAGMVMKQHGGRLPTSVSALDALPGIGSATAASIAAFAFNRPTVFIETNIRSVFIHFFFSKKKKVSDQEIFQLVKRTLDRKNPRKWYNALMDYGAMLKGQYGNPNQSSRHYAKQSKFEGSNRQGRGKVLRLLGRSRSISEKDIAREIDWSVIKIKKTLTVLEKEGLIRRRQKKWQMA